MIRNKLALGRLGTKRQCLACGAKYYDLGRKPPVCSRCGAGAEPKRASEQANMEPVAEDATVATQQSPAAGVAPSRPIGREWSREQAEAIDQVGRWLKQGEPQVFRLFGYAGVGKTTLARHIAEGARGETAFAAFTGKAGAMTLLQLAGAELGRNIAAEPDADAVSRQHAGRSGDIARRDVLGLL